MKAPFAAVVLAVAILAWAPAASPATADAKTTYQAAVDSATAAYKTARAQCKSLTGNAKDVCIAEAKAAARRSKAEARSQYLSTPEAQTVARMVAAEADYGVAKAKCGAKTGGERKDCIKEARAARAKAMAEAKPAKAT